MTLLPLYTFRNCFNSRSREGATGECPVSPHIYIKVSIHAPVRERHRRIPHGISVCVVSIHAPVRERRIPPCGGNSERLVSIHAPVRERRPARSPQSVYACSFNSRSREGATGVLARVSRCWRVSIHAPVRERLAAAARDRLALRVSIHAPVRERHCGDVALAFVVFVSIHAPVRERHQCRRHGFSAVGFNSRSREGATSENGTPATNERVSIHAPVRERQWPMG